MLLPLLGRSLLGQPPLRTIAPTLCRRWLLFIVTKEIGLRILVRLRHRRVRRPAAAAAAAVVVVVVVIKHFAPALGDTCFAAWLCGSPLS